MLDAGCGSGAVARSMGRSAANGHITGVDREPRYIQFARRQAAAEGLENVAFESGDVLNLPFDDGAFDVVWSKHLLQWVGEAQQAITEFRRVTRSGGRVVCRNFDGFAVWHHPVDPDLQKDIDFWFFDAARRELGFDSLIGRKLHNMFLEAGLTDVQVDFEPDTMYSTAGWLTEAQRWNWEVQFEAAKAFSERVMGSRERAGEFARRFIDYVDREDTYSFCARFWVEGRVP